MAAVEFDVVTLFPPMVQAFADYGVTGRAFEQGRARLAVWNPRDFATDNYRTVDDRPYGGGPGMVMLAEPLAAAIGAARARQRGAGIDRPRVIYMSPQGRVLDHAAVMDLAALPGMIFVAGRYEGIDERLIDREVDLELSIGDYVISGGELAALVVMDAVVRQLPGVLNAPESAAAESFVAGMLDWPHYTRPEVYDGRAVPPVLLSGNHAAIERWRRKEAIGRTADRRPDLLARIDLSAADRKLLAEYRQERNLEGEKYESDRAT